MDHAPTRHPGDTSESRPVFASNGWRTIPEPGKKHSIYRECLRNHAAGTGGHALDGCGEFMADSSDPLKCAACGCHRNFHRTDANIPRPFPLRNYYCTLPPPSLPPPPIPSSGGGGASPHVEALPAAEPGSVSPGSMRRRVRSKFSKEQKERMLAFAERVGWRLQRRDDGTIQRFCDEIGIKRSVLKVWMHNHKSNNHASKNHNEYLQQEEQRTP